MSRVRRRAWGRPGNGTLSSILVAAVDGGRTTDSEAAPRVAPVPSASETPAVLRRHRKNPTCTAAAMAEAFVNAISAALTSNTYGIAGGCTPSDGGVVFTNAKKQARLVPAPEFARLAAAYENAATEHQKNAW